jgi:unsaturated rhamnogalacturonyl hydrolase
MRLRQVLLTGLLLLPRAFLFADGHDDDVAERLKRETWLKDTRLVSTAIGVTRPGTSIPCWIDSAELADDPQRVHVWLVGGLDGSDTSIDGTIALMRWFHGSAAALRARNRHALSAIIIANPDGWANGFGKKNKSDGSPTRNYPPPPDAYFDPKNPEAQYVWRWLGSQAPDLAIEVRAATGAAETKVLSDEEIPERDSLAVQLGQTAAADMGTIPARRLVLSDKSNLDVAIKLVADQLSKESEHSHARRERLKRLGRSPVEVATQLSRRYGHSLKTVQYIPAVAIIGRCRLSELTGDASHREGIDQILAPFREGRQRAIGDQPSGSDFAGHLLFGELALKTGDQKLIALAKAAADFAFDDSGQPRQAMPAHVEMSDSVFMACPLLTQVGGLTGEVKYHDMSIRHLAFMRKLCARPDGLYRNSPLNDAAWGRGNGFPALGLAWALENLPEEHPGRADMLAAVQQHLTALAAHQDPTGMWHQVIDRSGSYRELTATCMITYAMIRGIRQGWLNRAKFEPLIGKAWPAIKARVAEDGSLIDVCEGTGKQTSLRAYLDRKAILGHDERGGAMSLLVATEMIAFEKARQSS